jgi:PAS domain S-box-containing protein
LGFIKSTTLLIGVFIADEMLNILLIDDNASDAELVKIALRGVPNLNLQCVNNLESFKKIFHKKDFSIILSDYNLFGNLGTDVLKYVRTHNTEIPFIMISGTLGEEKAVDILRQGATDYVLKSNLNKLPLVVSRALREAENKKTETLSNLKLLASENRLKSINQNSPDLIHTINTHGIITYSNRFFDDAAAKDPIGKNMLDFIHKEYQVKFKNHLAKAKRGLAQEFETIFVHAGLQPAWYRVRMALEQIPDPDLSILVISTDITVRKEAALREEVVSNISKELNKDITINAFLKKIRSELGKTFSTDSFYVGTYDKHKDELTFIYQFIENKPDRHVPYGRINGNGLSEYVIKTKKSLLLIGSEIDAFQHKRGIFIHMHKTRSWMGVPVMHNHEVFGMVAVLSFSQNDAFNKKDKELLTFVGSQIGAFIRRKEAEQKLKDSQFKWDSLVHHSGNLILTVTLKGKINYINQHTVSFKEIGLSPNQVLGKKFEVLAASSHKQWVAKKINQSIQTNKNSSFIMHGRVAGSYYDCTATPVFQGKKRNGLIVIVKNITDLIVAQNNIRESEERYKNVVQDQTEYIVRWKPDGKILFANQSFLDFNESTPNELYSQSYYTLIPKKEKTRFLLKIKALTQENPVLIDSHQSSRANKGSFWHEWVDRAFFDKNGQVFEYQSVGRDITIPKNAELKIKESEVFKQSILSALFSSIAVINQKGIIISTNEHWNNFSNENSGDLTYNGVGVSYLETYKKSAQNGDKLAAKALLGIKDILAAKKQLFELEYPRHSPLADRWFLMRVTPFKGADGGAVIAHYDISEQKLQQKKIIESENKYRSLFDKMHEGMFVSSEVGILKLVNPQFANMLGYKESELVDRYSYDFFADKADREHLMAKINDRKKGISESYETRMITKSGKYLYVNISSSPVYNDNGEFEGIMSIVSDISDRKSAEIKLNLSYNEIKNIEKISNALIHGKSLREISRIILEGLNKFSGIHFSKLYMLNPKTTHFELLEKVVTPVVLKKLEEQPRVLENFVPNTLTKESVFLQLVGNNVPFITSHYQEVNNLLFHSLQHAYQGRVASQLSNFIHVQTYGLLPIIANDEIQGILIFISSEQLNEYEKRTLARISKQAGTALAKKKTEDELKEYKENLEKIVENRTMELNELNSELEAFNYSVSHDLRTPIRAMDIYRGLLANELQNSELIQYVNQIERCTLEMNELIKALLEFSKMTKVPINIEEVDLNPLIHESFEKQKYYENSPNVQLKMTHMPVVQADYTLISIVINNLLSNAIKYSSKRTDALVEITYTETNNDVHIYIRDNGVGFSNKLAEKLFKPFSRLHHGDQFKGTGAGLALVHRILKRHHGTITAQSEVDKGSVFCFSLPLKFDFKSNEKKINNH